MKHYEPLNYIARAIGRSHNLADAKFDPTTETLSIDFGGLYETWHSDALECAELSAFQDAYISACCPKDIDDWYASTPDDLPDDMAEIYYDPAKWQYSNKDATLAYVRELFEFVSREFDFPQPLTVEHISWTRDNFSRPDLAVLAPIGEENYVYLLRWVENREDVLEWLDNRLRETTTSRDGFAPYYTYDELANDAGWLLRFIIERMVELCCDHDGYESHWNWYEYFSMNGNALAVDGTLTL